MGRRFTAALKAQVVQEIYVAKKRSQIAAKHKVHPNMVGQWKSVALKGLPMLFDEKRNAAAVKADHDAEIQELFEQIGRLSIENAWLKEKSGLERDSR